MQDSTLVAIQASRSAHGNALVLAFVLLHSVSLVIIAFAGDALTDSSVQLALAAALVIGTLWTVMEFDAIFRDFGALTKDLGGELAGSHLGETWKAAPLGVMRGVNVVFPSLLVIAQLMAIY